ncbi:MAG: hypothetical protein QG650_980, partial [Patescibacteria group bacterium]|nr:hypothetical protein [Patescibacteria group bacterium]
MSRLEILEIAGRRVAFDARLFDGKSELREALASESLRRLL